MEPGKNPIKSAFILLAVACSLFSSVLAWATPEEGLEFRTFLTETLRASTSSDPAARAEALRAVIARHPAVVRWVADGRDFQPILKDADLDGVQSVFGDQNALHSFLGDDVMTELRPAMKKMAGRGIKAWLMKAVLAIAGKNARVQKFVMNAAVAQFEKMTVSERLAALGRAGDEPFQKINGEVDRLLAGAKLSGAPAVQNLLDPQQGLQVKGFSAEKARLLNDTIGKYYDAIPLPEKRAILIAALDLPPRAPLTRQLSVVIQNSGPGIQKLFQQFGKDAKSELVQQVLAEMLSNVKPFPGVQARAAVERRLGRPISEIFSEFSDQPIAAATVGQAHQARLRATGEEVIVKVLRPDVVERAKREIQTLRSIAGASDFEQDLVNNLDQALMRELNFLSEAANIESGKAYIRPGKGLNIATVVDSIAPARDVLVLKMAPGVKMEKLPPGISPLERGDAVRNLLERWFDEAIFGSGNFHADLHPGNVFYRHVPGGKPPYELTVIDFGSFDRLTVGQRRGFMALAMAVGTKSPEQTADALAGISAFSPEKKTALIEKLRLVYARDMSLMDRLNESVLTALDEGLRLPRQFMMFNRGRLFLERALTEINGELDVIDPAGKLRRFDPVLSYAKVSTKRVGADMPKTLLSGESNQDLVMTRKMFTKFLIDNGKRVHTVIREKGCVGGILHMLKTAADAL